jgi:hypothetical protein
METNKLNEIEFLVLQTLANQVWISLLSSRRDNTDYIITKLRNTSHSNFESQPIYLVNMFDPPNQAKLFGLILNFPNKEIKEKLIKFFIFCAGDSYDNCWLCKDLGIEFEEFEKQIKVKKYTKGEENGDTI